MSTVQPYHPVRQDVRVAPDGPSVPSMIALVAIVVALVILVFFGLGYLFGRAFL